MYVYTYIYVVHMCIHIYLPSHIFIYTYSLWAKSDSVGPSTFRNGHPAPLQGGIKVLNTHALSHTRPYSHTYTHAHTHTHTPTHESTHTHSHTHTHILTNTHAHTRTYTYTLAHTQVWICKHRCACT